MASYQMITFSASDTDYSAYTELNTPKGAQVARVVCWNSATAGSATMRLIWLDRHQNIVLRAEDATLQTPASAVRQAIGGSSGASLMATQWADSSNDKIDLMPNKNNSDVKLLLGSPSGVSGFTVDAYVFWDHDI